jgi:hypothetical protein
VKSLLSFLALSVSFIVICGSLLAGMRIGPVLQRAVVVFLATYVGGLAVALLVTVMYLSSSKRSSFGHTRENPEKVQIP